MHDLFGVLDVCMHHVFNNDCMTFICTLTVEQSVFAACVCKSSVACDGAGWMKQTSQQ